MAQIITQDGTVIRNGISLPYHPDIKTRREPPTTAGPRGCEAAPDPRDHGCEAYRLLAMTL